MVLTEGRVSKVKLVYKKRQEAVWREMVKRGIEKALVTSPIDILYFTGADIIPYERFTGLLLDAETKKTFLIIPGFEKGHCQEEGTKELTYRDNEDALVIVADLIQGCPTVGVQKKALPFHTMERLVSLLELKEICTSYDILEIDSLLEGLRLYKDDMELEKLATAARYTGEILDKVKTKLMPGVSEQEIKFELFRHILLEDALIGPASPIQVSSGLHASMAHGMEGSKLIEAGDPVIIDFGVIFEHYRSDITRTFFVGQPKFELEKIYQIVWEAQQKAIEAVKPGRAIKEIDLAARNHIEKEGYGQYFANRVGHGLGMEIHEPPSVHNQNEQIIEEAMVFTIEPGIYIPGVGGVRIEDDIAVGKEGAILLTKYPKEFRDILIK